MQLCDLSHELLEAIAFYLSSAECLKLMLTCKRLHDIVSQGPLHNEVMPGFRFPSQVRQPIELLRDRLNEKPSVGVWIREYNLWATFMPDGSEEAFYHTYKTAQAIHLMDKMPKLTSLRLPQLPSSATLPMVGALINHVNEYKTLQEVHVWNNPSAYTLSFDSVAPLMTLPALRLLTLDAVDLRGSNWEAGMVYTGSDTLAELELECLSTDKEGLDRLFAMFPALQGLHLIDLWGIPIADALETSLKHYPRLRQLTVERGDVDGDQSTLRSGWLSDLPNLDKVKLSGLILGQADLLYLSHTATMVDLSGIDQPAAIAYAISQWIKAPAIKYRRTVTLSGVYLDEAFESAIVVCLIGSLFSTILMTRFLQRDCEGTLIDVQFR